MAKYALILAAITLLPACSDPMESAMSAVENELTYKNQIKYEGLTSYPGDVICGRVNSAGAWGEGQGFRKFVVRENRADLAPSSDDWAIFCSENPSQALQSQLGIGPVDKSNPKLLQVQQQLNELDRALQSYLTDALTYPPTQEGLQSLLAAHSPTAKAYATAIPEDPWGRPYIYEKRRKLHGAPNQFKLHTLGRDGSEGGKGEDADIGVQHLRYLNHISNLK